MINHINAYASEQGRRTGGGGGGVWLSCHYVKTELENKLEKDDKSIYYKKN